MAECKRCLSAEHTVKNGMIRGKQRYKCMKCGYIFVKGDEREKVGRVGKGLAVLLYATRLIKQKELAKILGVSRSSIQKWTKEWAKRTGRVEEGTAGQRILI